MKFKIEILPSAWEDLKRIEDYYLIQFDFQTAIKVSEHILSSMERLENFPDSGAMTPDTWLNEQGYRKIKDVIYICHIADTRTEYTKLFY
ncbi:type II toxin-antitoxin system RelE/ParE family toxin [Desulfoscipio sp. XC116]|uniref:type II toxin-antitoxin system RelE/ParE family toxin n=1 Tax=Desulfoscipio sp. XC116 TaxID=3144975 RepID=UPI00325A8DC1